MAATTSTVLATAAIVSAAATAAAGGLAYYSYQEQSATAQNVAAYNAAIQRQQADMTAQMQIRQSEINQSMLQTQLNQTQALDNQAESREAQAREQQRRIREDKLRMIGAQKAGFAKGGVLTEGTPLAVFAETELNYALMETDVFKVASEEATALRREADLARLDLNTQMGIEKMNLSAAKAGKDIAYNNAALTVATGAANARAYKLAGYGSLLSGVGQVASIGGDYYKQPVKPAASVNATTKAGR